MSLSLCGLMCLGVTSYAGGVMDVPDFCSLGFLCCRTSGLTWKDLIMPLYG